MTQLDLILETYLHAAAETVAVKVSEAGFARNLWPLWSVVVSEDRGPQGVRWGVDDSGYAGSCEAWVEAVASDACVLHTFVRIDRRGGRVSAWRRRRVRVRMVKALWRFKDDVEARVVRLDG